MKHTDRNRKNIGNCNWLRRALPVVLSALLLCLLTGCSVRDLHIGQVEVNTGIATAWITPAKGVDKFAIAAGDFSVRDDGTVTYTGTAYRALQGIDVSTFQQEIDWQAVADSGIDFAFIRAGYRGYGKGGIVEDDRFRQNVAGARAAGLCPGQRFRDMPASDIWSHEGLDYCIAAGLISGTSEVTVSPDMLATRAQIVQLLWAAAGSPETAGTLPFTDVSTDAWFYPAVRWAYRTGLVSGTSETTFDPEAPITRQDFALILYTQSGSPAMTGSVLRNFPDVEQVSGYAYAALTWAVEQGLINGVGTPEGALLAPHGYASRAQVATILMAYCDR